MSSASRRRRATRRPDRRRANGARDAYLEWRQAVFELLTAILIALPITLLLVAALLGLFFVVDRLVDTTLLPDAQRLLKGSAAPFLIIFSATTAGLFAARKIKSAHETVRLKETLDFIRATELDREYIQAKGAWSKYIGGGSSPGAERLSALISTFSALQIASELDKESAAPGLAEADARRSRALAAELRRIGEATAGFKGEVRDDAQFVFTYLNHFEIVALGIEQNIIDKEMYDDWLGTYVVQSWNASASVVGALRRIKRSDALFEKWQGLAQDWAASRVHLTAAEPPTFSLEELARLAIDFYETSRNRASERS